MSANDTYWYTVVISNNTPDRPQGGWIWVKPNVGQAYFYIEKQWLPLVGGGIITSYKEGFSWLRQYVQEAAPASPNIGQLWVKSDIHQCYMYLDQWQPVVGG